MALNGGEEPLNALTEGPYGGDAIKGASLEHRRAHVQIQMGAWIAGTILLSLVAAVGLIAYLAIVDRTADYVANVGQALQPFILPTLGALVGYSLREYQEHQNA
jgi:hypothetical protein